MTPEERAYLNLLPQKDLFKNLLEQKMKEAYDFNSDLLTEQNNLANEQASIGSTLRSEWDGKNIDPLTRESLIANRRALVGGRLGTVGDLLTQRGNYFGDIMGKAMNTYDTRLSAAQAAAQMAGRAAARRAGASSSMPSWLSSEDLGLYNNDVPQAPGLGAGLSAGMTPTVIEVPDKMFPIGIKGTLANVRAIFRNQIEPKARKTATKWRGILTGRKRASGGQGWF